MVIWLVKVYEGCVARGVKCESLCGFCVNEKSGFCM